MEELRQILDALGIHSLKVAAAILAVTLLTSIVKIPVKRAANKASRCPSSRRCSSNCSA